MLYYIPFQYRLVAHGYKATANREFTEVSLWNILE